MGRKSYWRASAAALLLLLVSGCTGYRNYHFGPSSLEVAVAPEGEETLARSLVSIRGIREVEDEFELVVRLRVESRVDRALLLEPSELLVVDAALEPIGDVRVEGIETTQDLQIPPHGVGVYELVFLFPPGSDPRDFDLSSINLRWGLSDAGETFTISSNFERRHPSYGPRYDPYYGPWGPYCSPYYSRFHFGVGFGHVDYDD